MERDYDAFAFIISRKAQKPREHRGKKTVRPSREMKFKIYLMFQKHNKKKKKKKQRKKETVCEWGRHWNNDDEIPGKMYRLEHKQKKRKRERKKREREGERKKLEEESSRFMAARPTERQWRWIQKWARKLHRDAQKKEKKKFSKVKKLKAIFKK
jgi:hypothetical protein